jgi:hypothetical protein
MAAGAIVDGTAAGVIAAGAIVDGAVAGVIAVGDGGVAGGAPGSTSVDGPTTATDIIRVTATTIAATTMAALTITAATAIAAGIIAAGVTVTGAIVDGTAAGVTVAGAIAVGAIAVGAIAVGVVIAAGAARHPALISFERSRQDQAVRVVLPLGPFLLCAEPDRASCNTATLLAWSAATLSRQGNEYESKNAGRTAVSAAPESTGNTGSDQMDFDRKRAKRDHS